MPSVSVRPATLDDVQAICRLLQAHVTAWQRIDARGQVEDVPYGTLTIYERWLHGGPWMSIETGAIQLSHLLRGAGLAVVAVVDGQVQGYSEAYPGLEPEPFGSHLHIAHRTTTPDIPGLDDALMRYWLEQAPTLSCQRLLTVSPPNDTDAKRFYGRHGLQPVARAQRFSLPARTGQVFYRAVEHLSANPAVIHGWQMPVGRFGSARQEWENRWPRTWFALPELRGRRTYRLHFSVAGQEAFVYCEQQLYVPRSIDVFCWTPKPLSSQVLTAMRDWAHREGYRTLVMLVMDETARLLGSEAEPDGYAQEILGVQV